MLRFGLTNRVFNRDLTGFGHRTFATQTENPEIVKQREDRKRLIRDSAFAESTKHLPEFQQLIKQKIPTFFPLRAQKPEEGGITTLQINIGKKCNLVCKHCHVESGPTRTENMEKRTAERLMDLLGRSKTINTVDLTGGAPEMNPFFKYVVKESRKMNKTVLNRSNLTIFFEDGYTDLPQFLAENNVKVIASLPCYTLENVEKQRGKGVFDQSIEALKILNKLGYGESLELDLVYNPGGPNLPGNQQQLERDYKDQLSKNFGLRFNHLYTITNMPIKRFADDLLKWGEYQKYMELLVNSFNPQTIQGLMCRYLVNVSWDGVLYDCDFNQALDLPMGKKNKTIWDINSFDELSGHAIATGKHCYGCTAGAGSSCSGSLTK